MKIKGLLDGVVVLDLTRVLAGPYCGAILADMGATVIKVENPKGGDDSRSMGPFVNDNSVYFANFNRSKVGCTLNLKDPEAKRDFQGNGEKGGHCHLRTTAPAPWKSWAWATMCSRRSIRRSSTAPSPALATPAP